MDDDDFADLVQVLREQDGIDLMTLCASQPAPLPEPESKPDSAAPVALPQPDRGPSGGSSQWTDVAAAQQTVACPPLAATAPGRYHQAQLWSQTGPPSPGQYAVVPQRSVLYTLQPVGVLIAKAECHVIPAAPPSNIYNSRGSRKKQKRVNSGVPYVKKPPNAFMLYLREQRPIVMAELAIRKSTDVNAELGKRWKSLSNEEQAKYFEWAGAEARLHAQRHPDPSVRDDEEKKRAQTAVDTMTRSEASHPPENTPTAFGNPGQPDVLQLLQPVGPNPQTPGVLVGHSLQPVTWTLCSGQTSSSVLRI